MGRKRLITEKKKEDVIKMYAEGYSYKEMSFKLDVNQGSICNIIKHYKIPFRKRKPHIAFPKPDVDPNCVGAFGKGFWDDNLIMKC